MISDAKHYEEKIGRIQKRSLSASLLSTFFCICNLRAGPCLKFLCMPIPIMQGAQQAQQTTELNWALKENDKITFFQYVA